MHCFPATLPEDFISLRTWDKEGKEVEIGIVRHVGRWSKATQDLLRAALARRYFLRSITGIDQIKVEYGRLRFSVRTEQGATEFTMPWNQSRGAGICARGKVLLDVEDNRFLVPDVDGLPPRDRELLQRYVYW